MVLSRREILAELERGRLVIEPAVDPVRIEQVSVDLRLGRRFTSFRRGAQQHVGALQVEPSLWSADLWEHREEDVFLLQPGQFVLAQTLEHVTIPNDLMGLVEGRSSFARVGVSAHVSAPKIDPGFSGTITLEMMNVGPVPVMLRAGTDRPCQLVLLRLSSPVPETEVYGTRATHTFQGQRAPLPGRE